MKNRKADRGLLERLALFTVERRNLLSLRQQDLADRSGLSIAWIGKLEGRRLTGAPLNDTLKRLVVGLRHPDELPGNLYSFLELLLAGRIGPRTAKQVALGRRSVDEAIKDLLEGKGVELSKLDQGMSTALFLDRDLRSRRLETILAMLQEDLSEDDFQLASLLVRRLYEDAAPLRKVEEPRTAPRRRSRATQEKP